MAEEHDDYGASYNDDGAGYGGDGYPDDDAYLNGAADDDANYSDGEPEAGRVRGSAAFPGAEHLAEDDDEDGYNDNDDDIAGNYAAGLEDDGDLGRGIPEENDEGSGGDDDDTGAGHDDDDDDHHVGSGRGLSALDRMSALASPAGGSGPAVPSMLSGGPASSRASGRASLGGRGSSAAAFVPADDDDFGGGSVRYGASRGASVGDGIGDDLVARGHSRGEPADEDGDEDDDEDDEEEEDEEDDDGIELERWSTGAKPRVPLRDIEIARRERAALRAVHRARQRLIMRLWAHDTSGAARNELLHVAEARAVATHNAEYLRHQYAKRIDVLSVAWDRLDERREAADAKVSALTAVLDKHDEKMTRLQDAFRTFRREVAAQAVHSKTGRMISRKKLLSLEEEEENVEKVVAEARLKCITLREQIQRLQNDLKRKDELSEGLHLIDFEQLKIENTSLNDQIEERGDQLHKLLKKTVSTVQVLTHVREKLQHLRHQNTRLQGELTAHSVDLTTARDQLSEFKQLRDRLRAENAVLKQKQGFVGSDALVQDFEERKVEVVELQQRLAALKAEHAALQAVIVHAKKDTELTELALGGGQAPTVRTRTGYETSAHATGFGSSNYMR